MVIKEFQNLTSFILHMIQHILGECLYKKNLRHIVLNEVFNVIFNVISDHNFILPLFEI